MKKFNLKKEYKEARKYLKESKNFIWIILGLFLISILIGFFISPPTSISEKIMQYLSELLEKTSGMSSLELTKFIFLNNIQSSFFGMAFGVFLGIFPLIYTFVNGYVLGFVASMSVQTSGILSLWRIFPHGIFELPAVIISFALGLKIGLSLFKRNQNVFLEYIKKSLKVFLLIILPLLIIAAIIEGLLIGFT